MKPLSSLLTAALIALPTVNHAQQQPKTYLGMVARFDGSGGVQMFSATSGQLLRWILANEFTNVYVLKNKPEYPVGD